MASRSKTIADALVVAINALTLPTPAASFTLASPLAATYFAPEIRRDADELLRIFVSPFRRERALGQTRDRCLPRWSTDLYVIPEKRLTSAEATNEMQPGTVAEIDFFIEFCESLAEQLANTNLIGSTAKLLGIDHEVLLSPDHLKSHVLFGQIGVTYA